VVRTCVYVCVNVAVRRIVRPEMYARQQTVRPENVVEFRNPVHENRSVVERMQRVMRTVNTRDWKYEIHAIKTF